MIKTERFLLFLALQKDDATTTALQMEYASTYSFKTHAIMFTQMDYEAGMRVDCIAIHKV